MILSIDQLLHFLFIILFDSCNFHELDWYLIFVAAVDIGEYHKSLLPNFSLWFFKSCCETQR